MSMPRAGYTSDQVLLQLFEDDFGFSEEESSGNEVEGTYTYPGSQVVEPDAVVALRRTVATDSLATLGSLANS